MEQGGTIPRVQRDMILKDQGDMTQMVRGDMTQMVQGDMIQTVQGGRIQTVRGDKMIPGGRGDRWKALLEVVALCQSQYHLQEHHTCKCKAKTIIQDGFYMCNQYDGRPHAVHTHHYVCKSNIKFT